MGLGKILRSIGNWIAGIFKGMKPVLKKAVAIGVDVVNAAKNWDDKNGSFLDALTTIIPGDADEKILANIRERLPVVLIELRLVQATSELTDPKEIVDAGVKVLQQLSGDYRAAFLNSLAIIISQVAADGKLDWDDATYLIKWYYDHQNDDDVDTDV